VLVGSHLTNHHFGIHGVNWQFEPSSNSSGFRDNQGMGISEHSEFLFRMPWTAANTTTFPCPYGSGTPRPIACADYLYNPGAGQIDFGQGLWGLLRGYNTGGDGSRLMADLAPLPTNPNGGAFPTGDTTCPDGAPVRTFWVSAESPSTPLIYNNKVASQPVTQANPLIFVPMTANFAGKMFPNDKPEPLVLRANAGDCIIVNFRNNFSTSSPAFTTVDTGTPATQPWFTFGGQPVATVVPSTYAGLHPQMVAYDVTQSSGMAIGVNPTNGVLPIGSPGTVKQYKWYAGRIGPNLVNRKITGDPVEFGTSNLLPTDFIEQPVNSMVGALVIEPANSRFVRSSGNTNLQGAVVDGSTGQHLFREFVTIFQDRLQKSGTLSFKAVNYSAEPMNYRYNASISNQNPTNGLWQAYSNSLPVQNVSTNPAWGNPQTTIFLALKGEKVRFRVAHPMGLGGFPDNVFTLHGHVWQEEPYTNQSSSLGFNPKSEWIGSRDGFGPQHHFDVLIDSAGGTNKIPGDYIYEDYNNTSNGIWGLMRVFDTTAAFEAELATPESAPVAVPLRERSQRRAIQDPVIDQFHSDLAIEMQREQLAIEEDEDDDDPAVPPNTPPNQ
jgi:manganese oxidase